MGAPVALWCGGVGLRGQPPGPSAGHIPGPDPFHVGGGVEVPEGRRDQVVGDRQAFDVGGLGGHEVAEEAGLEAFEVPALGVGGREEDSVEVGEDVFGDDLRGVHGPSIPHPIGLCTIFDELFDPQSAARDRAQ